MSERGLEIRVGAFVLAALVVLVAFVVVLGDVSFGGRYDLHVDYAYTGPIQAGAPVKVSGVQVGQVKAVRFLGGEQRGPEGEPLLVRLDLALEDRARTVATEGAEFAVGTQGLLGEPFVEIVPGPPEAEPYPEDAVIRGRDSTRTDQVLARAMDLVDSLATTVSENEEALTNLLQGAGGVARTFDQLLSGNREELDAALDDVVAAAADLRRLAQQARSLTAEGGDLRSLATDARVAVAALRRDLPPLLAHLRTGAEELARLSEATRSLGPEDVERVEAMLAHYETVGRHLAGLTGDLEGMVARMERGQGSLGALLQDDQLYDDLRALLRDLKAHPWKIMWKE